MYASTYADLLPKLKKAGITEGMKVSSELSRTDPNIRPTATRLGLAAADPQ